MVLRRVVDRRTVTRVFPWPSDGRVPAGVSGKDHGPGSGWAATVRGLVAVDRSRTHRPTPPHRWHPELDNYITK